MSNLTYKVHSHCRKEKCKSSGRTYTEKRKLECDWLMEKPKAFMDKKMTSEVS